MIVVDSLVNNNVDQIEEETEDDTVGRSDVRKDYDKEIVSILLQDLVIIG